VTLKPESRFCEPERSPTGFIAGHVAGVDVAQSFSLAAGVLVEIPRSVVLLSRILVYRANRFANIIGAWS